MKALAAALALLATPAGAAVYDLTVDHYAGLILPGVPDGTYVDVSVDIGDAVIDELYFEQHGLFWWREYDPDDPHFGNEDSVNLYCAAWGGCLTEQSSGVWTGRLVGFAGVEIDVPCTPEVVGFCYAAYLGDDSLLFQAGLDGGPHDVRIALSDPVALSQGLFRAPTAVPEPTTWVTLLVGFAGLGGALRRGGHLRRPICAVASSTRRRWPARAPGW